MEGFKPYIDLVMKEMYNAVWKGPADLRTIGYGAFEPETNTSAMPIDTKRAVPGDYAYSWQAVMCSHPILSNSGHTTTDYALAVVYAINRVHRQYVARKDDYRKAFKQMIADATIFSQKHKEAHDAAREARHQIHMHVQYQRDLQARAKRALEDHKGTSDSYEEQQHQWNISIGFAGRLLYDKGLVYANERAKVLELQKIRAEMTKQFEKTERDEARLSHQLQEYGEPEFQFVLEKVNAALDTMRKHHGNDERYVRL